MSRFRNPARVVGLLAPLLLSLTACGPSPARVCDHMIELTDRELGEQAAATVDADKCRELMRREREARGITEYRAQASCILDADGYEQLSACR